MKLFYIGFTLFILIGVAYLGYLGYLGFLITVLGSLMLITLIMFLVMHALSCVISLKAKNDLAFEMPHLIPIVIPTKHLQCELHRTVALVTTVRHWKLAKAWKYKMNNGTILAIPVDFKFDGASIPKPLWGILSPTGLLLIPGLIHDYAYRHGQLWELDENGKVDEYRKGEGKKVWDDLFEEIGNEVNNFKLINWIAKTAIRLCGGLAWDNHADSRKKNDAIKPVFKS